MAVQIHRYDLRNRYVFTGKLVMLTAFHIGGAAGQMHASSSDSPVVLTPEEVPFIPGSSMKGVLRSTVEKLTSTLPGNWFSCGLVQLNNNQAKEIKAQNGRICPTAWSGDSDEERRRKPERAEEIREEDREKLCDTCRLFGSPITASRITVQDLYMPLKDWHGVLQIRDGVAIDRDSERAKDRLKYDFEVVPVGATFDFKLLLENATAQDLQLLSVGLSELIHGFGTIGGKRSRGLGACYLEQLHISELELTGVETAVRNRRLRDYLLHKTFSRERDEEASIAFLNENIEQIFTGHVE